jgi:hypothetical protein
MPKYELGWILWPFGADKNYPELTERQEFVIEHVQFTERHGTTG